MLFRAIAPLRLGFAGGGTDLSPYSDIYGGHVLNACVNMYAHATIEPTKNGKIILVSYDLGESEEHPCEEQLPEDSGLILLQGVYNYLAEEFGFKNLSFKLSTFVDAPAGSGLGSSSTLVVAIIKAFSEWQKLPLGEYDIAHLAYVIERQYLKMAGGKQDQYAAAFGGFNFMEFYADDKVIVNPLRINENIINELNSNLVIYFTGTRRESAKIIEKQIKSTEIGSTALDATHKLKEQAIIMKQLLLRGELNSFGNILHMGWLAKKSTADAVSNDSIDKIYNIAIAAGAAGGKVSGAGGGGFMMFYCPKLTRYSVITALKEQGGVVKDFRFTKHGAQSWIVMEK